MRRATQRAGVLLGLLLLLEPGAARAAEAGCRTIEMFSQAGCPHCAEGRRFLDALSTVRPDVEIRILDVADREHRERLRALFEAHGIAPGGVPTFSICGEVLVGFGGADSTGARILELLGPASSGTRSGSTIEVPVFRSLDAERLGLPLFTVAVGLVDGFNPCAMWVLLVLLSVLVNVRDRRKLVIVAGTFVAVSGLAYFAFMAAWLNVFLLVGWSRPTQLLLGAAAVGIGGFHLKDFVAFGRGPSLSIPGSAKPGIYRRVRDILHARSLAAALGGPVVLAVLVNLVELLCTAGLPAIYTRILTLNELPTVHYYGYLALYNLAYVFDDLLMVTIVVVSLDRLKLQERAGRWLKGLSGSVMVALGLVLLLRPGWLQVL